MYFVRLYDDGLAQASYLIGCSRSGTAVVVDPNRMADRYLEAAAARGLRITAVTETHIHADFISGSLELAARTGATVYVSGCGPAEWRYAFAGKPGIQELRNRSEIPVGQVTLTAVHTPGHTPEHVSFLVTDGAVADEPMGILTGDFVFVGDVGRPDLLEEAAGIAGAADVGARQLFRSVAWFKTLPPHLQVWPGHGAGSACGKGLSAVPQSTVGFECRHNPAMLHRDEEDFVRAVLEGQPEPPGYFGRMKRINRDGPALLGKPAMPPRLADAGLPDALQAHRVVDTRLAADFAGGHIPGTLSIPFNKSFPTWAGSLLSYEEDLYLIVDSRRAGGIEAIVDSLAIIGLERVRGWFEADVVKAWKSKHGSLETTRQLSVEEVARRRDQMLVLDVRGQSEWEHGHIPGATHIPLAELPERLAELPKEGVIAVHCQGGGRSAIAASLLLSKGYAGAANVEGGFGAWEGAGLPHNDGQKT